MKVASFVLLLISNLLFTGCSKQLHQSTSTQEQSVVMPIQVPKVIAQNMSGFTFNFFKELQSTQSDSDNIFVSPLSLHMDLGMLLNGAAGNTYNQMTNALQLQNLSLAEVDSAYQTLLQDLPKADKQVQLGLYNSIWYRNSFSVEPNYMEQLKNYFDATIQGLPFVSSDADIINNWASDKTNGKIKNVIDKTDITAHSIMFLLNALYFKGNWSTQFDKSKTKDYTFHLENGNTKQVKMMMNTDTFHYSFTDNYKAIRLPYGNGQFSMFIILPNTGNTIADILNSMNASEWNNLQNNINIGKVQIGLPRFEISNYNINLINTLQKMGVTDLFSSSSADLTKINSNALSLELYVNLLKQFTYLNVDEQGTEAAAVTVGGIVTTSMPFPSPSIICDHPFGLIISERTSNTILFMGRIMNPNSQ
ncbi:MAG TPA: serpin family protein [Arachidicoccus soli]|nr:serpin family protein [Arachidicoccus soli]